MFFFKRKLDIHSKKRGIAGRLSNFTKRSFVFDGMACRSIEGVLQSFKFQSFEEQAIVCGLWGIQAKLAGENRNWKQTQTLFWNGKAYRRESDEYQHLIDRLYLAVFEQDEHFRKDILKAGTYRIEHRIGSRDPKETVLTEAEFIGRLKMLYGRTMNKT